MIDPKSTPIAFPYGSVGDVVTLDTTGTIGATLADDHRLTEIVLMGNKLPGGRVYQGDGVRVTASLDGQSSRVMVLPAIIKAALEDASRASQTIQMQAFREREKARIAKLDEVLPGYSVVREAVRQFIQDDGAASDAMQRQTSELGDGGSMTVTHRVTSDDLEALEHKYPKAFARVQDDSGFSY